MFGGGRPVKNGLVGRRGGLSQPASSFLLAPLELPSPSRRFFSFARSPSGANSGSSAAIQTRSESWETVGGWGEARPEGSRGRARAAPPLAPFSFFFPFCLVKATLLLLSQSPLALRNVHLSSANSLWQLTTRDVTAPSTGQMTGRERYPRVLRPVGPAADPPPRPSASSRGRPVHPGSGLLSPRRR